MTLTKTTTLLGITMTVLGALFFTAARLHIANAPYQSATYAASDIGSFIGFVLFVIGIGLLVKNVLTVLMQQPVTMLIKRSGLAARVVVGSLTGIAGAAWFWSIQQWTSDHELSSLEYGMLTMLSMAVVTAGIAVIYFSLLKASYAPKASAYPLLAYSILLFSLSGILLGRHVDIATIETLYSHVTKGLLWGCGVILILVAASLVVRAVSMSLQPKAK
jgi:hypothetical protein